jgi:hypothetical protein
MLVLAIFALVWCWGVWGQGSFRAWIALLIADDGSPDFELKGRFIQVSVPFAGREISCVSEKGHCVMRRLRLFGCVVDL